MGKGTLTICAQAFKALFQECKAGILLRALIEGLFVVGCGYSHVQYLLRVAEITFGNSFQYSEGF